jgi:hypothetical protein
VAGQDYSLLKKYKFWLTKDLGKRKKPGWRNMNKNWRSFRVGGFLRDQPGQNTLIFVPQCGNLIKKKK